MADVAALSVVKPARDLPMEAVVQLTIGAERLRTTAKYLQAASLASGLALGYRAARHQYHILQARVKDPLAARYLHLALRVTRPPQLA